METIKIIDLLVDIANGKEVPKKIKYKNIIFSISKGKDDYISENGSWFTDCFCFLELNDNVEIIEDTFKHFGKKENQAVRNIIKKISIPVKENYNDYYEDKKIEKIDISNFPKRNNSLKKTALKVNEIIDNMNEENDEEEYYNIKEKINELVDKMNEEINEEEIEYNLHDGAIALLFFLTTTFIIIVFIISFLEKVVK